jgi:hypothetical protein
MKVFVAGAPGAGKTVYIATLFRAAFSMLGGYRDPPKVRPAVGDEASRVLRQTAQDILTGRLPAATSRLSSARVLVDLPGSIVCDIGRLTVTLDIADPPGGHCFVAPGKPLDRTVARHCAECDGALVLLPADATDGQRRELVEMLDRFLANVREAKRFPAGTPPFDRIVVAVSKAELLVKGAERPLNVLDYVSPIDILTRLYGKALFDVARRGAPSGGDWYSTVSAFGFRRTTGKLAAVRRGEDWTLPDDPNSWDEWTPFRLLEPIEFLARGVCWRESYSLYE